jgi:hypothetical protein
VPLLGTSPPTIDRMIVKFSIDVRPIEHFSMRS